MLKMSVKSLLALFITLFCLNTFAQSKVFCFNEIQCRNSKQEWEKSQKIDKRTVQISDKTIEVKLDKDYILSIVSSTLLPNEGVIYLCKDTQQNDVTVTLINDEKMFLYSKTNRYQITFNHPAGIQLGHSAFAEIDD
jgi:hypothetical protein